MFYFGGILYIFILSVMIMAIPNAFNLGHITAFIHPMSFLIIAGSLVSVVIASGQFKEVLIGFKSVSGKVKCFAKHESGVKRKRPLLRGLNRTYSLGINR